jgi:hypothetical protein
LCRSLQGLVLGWQPAQGGRCGSLVLTVLKRPDPDQMKPVAAVRTAATG